MIYVGYSCIGKTSIAGTNNFIDLESSLFNDGSENWAEKYIAVADDLSEQGYYVFVSSHKVVRDALKAKGRRFICVFPDSKLEDVWYERMCKRFKNDPTEKNLRALQRCATSYKKDIADLKTEDLIAVITDLNYNDLIKFMCNCKVQERFGTLRDENSSGFALETRSNKTIDDLWENSIEETPSEN